MEKRKLEEEVAVFLEEPFDRWNPHHKMLLRFMQENLRRAPEQDSRLPNGLLKYLP